MVSKNVRSRAVSPVVATLFLVAITVVAGTLIFVFASGYYGSTQISGTPIIELIKIIGYDARDVSPLEAHDGNEILPTNCCGVADNLKQVDERLVIYVKNDSVQQVVISELRAAGTVYNYSTSSGIGNWNGGSKPQPEEYVIMTGPDGMPGGDLLEDQSPSIQPGQTVTILLDMSKQFPIGRDIQFQFITSEGNLFSSTLIIGQSYT